MSARRWILAFEMTICARALQIVKSPDNGFRLGLSGLK